MSYENYDDFYHDFGGFGDEPNTGQHDDSMEPFKVILECDHCGRVQTPTVTHPSDEFYCCGRRLCG